MKHSLYYIFIILSALSFFSCEEDRDTEEQNINTQTEFVLQAPAIGNRADDAGTAPQTTAEMLADGSAIQDIAVFVSKENGDVEVYRQMSLNCSGENAAASAIKFTLSVADSNADNWALCEPYKEIFDVTAKHSANLSPQGQGMYEVYAVANYKDNATVNNIIAAANAAADKGSKVDLNAQLANLKSSVINATDGLYDSSQMMILSLHDKINVTPGEQTYRSSLLRPCARVRITVRNECVNYKMSITDLKFGKMSRTSSPLFAPDNIDDQLPDAVPVMSSGAAKIPFSSVTINKNVPVDKDGTKFYDNQAVVFDGCLLENKNENGYDFQIAMRAETGGVSNLETEYIRSDKYQQFMNKGEYYIISMSSNGQVLFDDGSGNIVKRDDVDLNVLDDQTADKYLWLYDGKYIITRSNPDVHIVANKNGVSPNGSPVMLGTQSNSNDMYGNYGHIYWEGDLGSDGYSLQYTNFYITDGLGWMDTDTESDYWSGGYTPGALPYYGIFTFYPVTIKTTGSGLPVSTQKFQFIKMVNKKPRTVREIRRNDFYHMFINVRYNEKLGTFDFEVEKWNEGGGDIEFY